MFEGDLPNDCEQSRKMSLTRRCVAIKASFSRCALFSIAVIHFVQVVAGVAVAAVVKIPVCEKNNVHRCNRS